MSNFEPMFAEERKQQIIELIRQKRKVSVKELCKRFGTSPGTIRNDLSELEKLDLLNRTHGGAISASKIGFERRSQEKAVKCHEEKLAIARIAASYVEDGDTIALDTGTTTVELAKELSDRENLTVVTNDLVIAMLMEDFPHTNILFIGGMVRKGFHCAVGPPSINALSEIRVDKTFLAGNGLTAASGVTTPDVDTAHLKRELISIADQVILLCDSSKIGRSSFIQIAALDQIDLLITDEYITKESLEVIQSAGLEVITAALNKNRDESEKGQG